MDNMTNTGDRNAGNSNTGNSNTGDSNTGDSNTGDSNTGDSNTGDRNTGYWNTGDRNTGYGNTGDRNTGYWNTGYGNTGNSNTGDSNTGNSNTGGWNTGDRNTGYWNTGDWNKTDYSTGFLNTRESKVIIFNKETNTSRDDIDFPSFFYAYNVNIWINESEMTDEEKKTYPYFYVQSGYLKMISPEEAWRKAWDGADLEDKKKVLLLPNWDNEVFKEISGIDAEQELMEKPKEFTMDEVAKALGVDIKDLKIKKD